MITLSGNGRLTRDVRVRTTHSGKTVATVSVASDRRDRDAQSVYRENAQRRRGSCSPLNPWCKEGVAGSSPAEGSYGTSLKNGGAPT
jgi:hypothetical protein